MRKPLLKDEITPLRQPCPWRGLYRTSDTLSGRVLKRPVFCKTAIQYYRNRFGAKPRELTVPESFEN
jgi:hypothetical protein